MLCVFVCTIFLNDIDYIEDDVHFTVITGIRVSG